MKTGKLIICPTPIGNLEDITLRALRVLKEADVIAAEDTRHTLKLLNHYEIQKPLTSYHEHNKASKGLVLLEKLQSGENIVLVSDAGMPGISDPGADLVQLCIEHHIDVEVLPGATAFVTALVASGLSTAKFAFEGFLDKDKKERRKRLELLSKEDRTLIFYESPHRLLEVLKDMLQFLGNRKIVLGRELTKIHEEIFRGNLEESLKYFEENSPRGEFVVMVGGISQEQRELENKQTWEHISIEEHILLYIKEGMDKKEAVKKVAKERNLSKREIYSYSINL